MSLNNWSLGIELVNVGPLIGKPGNWRTSWGKSVPDDEVVTLPHQFDGKVRGWQRYTSVQLEVAAAVAAKLVTHYGLKDIIGQEDISPGRKWGPGPAFPMDGFRALAMGEEQESPAHYETIRKLNIRVGPGLKYATLPKSPLAEGARLELLKTDGIWSKVRVIDEGDEDEQIVGWVHGRFIRPGH